MNLNFGFYMLFMFNIDSCFMYLDCFIFYCYIFFYCYYYYLKDENRRESFNNCMFVIVLC